MTAIKTLKLNCFMLSGVSGLEMVDWRDYHGHCGALWPSRQCDIHGGPGAAQNTRSSIQPTSNLSLCGRHHFPSL